MNKKYPKEYLKKPVTVGLLLDNESSQEKQFRSKVVELFKKHKIGTAEDLAYLEGLVAGT